MNKFAPHRLEERMTDAGRSLAKVIPLPYMA